VNPRPIQNTRGNRLQFWTTTVVFSASISSQITRVLLRDTVRGSRSKSHLPKRIFRQSAPAIRVTAFANPAIRIGDGLVIECYGDLSDHSYSYDDLSHPPSRRGWILTAAIETSRAKLAQAKRLP
jgi:hypothetical protein